MSPEGDIGEQVVGREIDQILTDTVEVGRRGILANILIRAGKIGARVYLVGGIAEVVENEGRESSGLERMEALRAEIPRGGKTAIPDIDIFVACPGNLFDRALVGEGDYNQPGWDLSRTVDHGEMIMYNDYEGRALEAKRMEKEGDVIGQLSREGYCSLLAVGQIEIVDGKIVYRRVWPNGFIDQYEDPGDRVDGEIGQRNRMGPIVALRLGLKAMTNYLLLNKERKEQLGVNDQTIIDLLKRRMVGFGDFKFPNTDYASTPEGSRLARWGLYLIERMIDCLAIDRDVAETLIRQSGLGELYYGMPNGEVASGNIFAYLTSYVRRHNGHSAPLARDLLRRLTLILDGK